VVQFPGPDVAREARAAYRWPGHDVAPGPAPVETGSDLGLREVEVIGFEPTAPSLRSKASLPRRLVGRTPGTPAETTLSGPNRQSAAGVPV